eukprot:RCo006862
MEPTSSNCESFEDEEMEESTSAGLEDEVEEPKSLMAGVQVMDERTIVAEMRSLADRASALTNLTTSAACRVLKYYDWNYSKLEENYFDHADEVRHQLGIRLGQEVPFREVPLTEGNPFMCPICIENFPNEKRTSVWALVSCGHAVCADCWTDTLSAAVAMGRTCSNLTCPMGSTTGNLGVTSCKTFIDEKMFEKFLSPELFKKYQYYLIRSFVDTNPHIRWCPSPGCDRAIRCTDTSRKIVPCLCGFSCCFKCSDESHAPASCEQMREWKIREAGESDNLAYINAHTKPCPTCATPIERNEGCNHMTCVKCKAAGKPPDWCWVCGQIWDFKGKHLSNWYDCPFKADKSVLERQKLAAAVDSELFKYVHYYEGYARHEQIRKFQVRKDTERAEEHKARIMLRNPGVDADFIVQAVQALVQARTYLKFSYVYAYYLDSSSKEFFDWKVGETETVVNAFSNMLEDLYRWGADANRLATEEAPWSRSQIMDKAALLKHRLNDVMSGVEHLKKDHLASA